MAAKTSTKRSKTTRPKGDKATRPGKSTKAKAKAKPKTKAKPKATGAARAQVVVVNLVPKSLSGETNQDSEPSLAVNPANPLEIVGTAFTPDPMGGALAPVYVSIDGGTTWRLNSIVPSAVGSTSGTGDISLAYASSGGR